MIFWLSFVLAAQADSAVALVRVDAQGAHLLDVVRGPDLRAPAVAAEGPLRVLGSDGQVLAQAALPDGGVRSIIFPEGGGEVARLDHSVVRVWLPWPAGAATVSLGDVQQTPRIPPPVAVATEVSVGGPSEERLDFLFLGDGYTQDELGQFASDVDAFSAAIQGMDPYTRYADIVNHWRVDQASNESGASHYDAGQSLERDTAYGCFYGCGGIDRLLCCDDSKVLTAVNEALPAADGIIVMVNDPTYGGAGGQSYATTYNDPVSGPAVAAHEVGHHLIGLWDEYDYGYRGPSDGEGPNCSSPGSGNGWGHWEDVAGVGEHPPCSYNDWNSPTQGACLMYSLDQDYCPVCLEQATLNIYALLPGIISAQSRGDGTAELAVGAAGGIELAILGPALSELDITWSVDGVEVGEGPSLPAVCTEAGAELLVSVTVHDPTPWVRADPEGLLSDSAEWTALCVDGGSGDGGDGGDGGTGADGGSGGADDGAPGGGVDAGVETSTCACSAGISGGVWLWLGCLGLVWRRRRNGGIPGGCGMAPNGVSTRPTRPRTVVDAAATAPRGRCRAPL